MSAARDRFDWQSIHAALERRLASLGTSFEHDGERAQAILRERSTQLAFAPADRGRHDGAAPFLVFHAAGARYGLPLSALQEIARLTRVVTVPGAAACVRGVMSWRGSFVTVFDIAPILDLPATSSAAFEYAAIFRGEAPHVGLAIERAEAVQRLDAAALQPPDTWQSGRPDLFCGASADAVAVFDAARLSARLRNDLQAA